MNLKYLYGKIMEADPNNGLVKIPFLTQEDLGILKANDISCKKVGNGYHVNALQAKAVFCH